MDCNLNDAIKKQTDATKILDEKCQSNAVETCGKLVVDCGCIQVPKTKVVYSWKRLFIPQYKQISVDIDLTLKGQNIRIDVGDTYFWIQCFEDVQYTIISRDLIIGYEKLLEAIAYRIIIYKKKFVLGQSVSIL